MPAQTRQIKQVSFVGVARDKTATPGSTTLTAAGAVGAATLTVAAITNFQVGDLFRIGAGEDVELCQVHGSTAPSGSTITLMEPLKKAHANAEPVVEQLLYDLGDVSAAGVEYAYNGESTEILVSTKRLTYAILTGFVDATMGFTLPNMSLHAFALSMGLPFARISTNGSVLAVTGIIEDGNNFGGEANQSLVCVAVRNDGTVIRAELWGVDFDYTGVTVGLARASETGVAIRGLAAGGGALVDANTYNLDVSIRPTKGKVFAAINEIGHFGSPGTPTTSAVAIAAADTNTINLTDVTGMAAGDWLKFGSGELAEYHQIDGIAALVVTLRSKFLRAQPIGTDVVEVTPTAFPGVSVAGATFSTGGSVSTNRIATRRQSIGLRLGNVSSRLNFAITNFDLENFVLSLGLPASALAAGRLTITDLIGTTALDGVYAKGTLLDGTTFWVICAGCSQDLAGWLVNFNNAGDPPTMPFSLAPSSHFSLLNHA